MAEGQTIGIVISAGVLGGMIGAVLTALYCTFRRRVLDVRAARRDAIAGWLGLGSRSDGHRFPLWRRFVL